MILNLLKPFAMLFEHLTIRRISGSSVAQMQAMLGALDKSDLPFMYHHLRKGCILTASRIDTGNASAHLYAVHYGPFFLGILNSGQSRKLAELESIGTIHRLVISSMTKEKYMPPTAIEVELSWSEQKLAEVA